MLAKKIAFNTIISAGARILGISVALLTIGLLTRYLSKSAWGEYSIVVTMGGIFAVVAEFGLYQLLVREISREGADESKITSNLFTLRLLVSFFIFALAPLLSLFLPYSAQARWGILIGMLGFWFLSASQVLMGVFQKHLCADRASWADLAGRLLQLGLVFFLIKAQAGFLTLVAAFSLSSLGYLIVIYILAAQRVTLRLSFDREFWRWALRESWPLAIANILVMIYFSSDALFLSILKPAADVGIYRLPYKILEGLIFFPAMFVGLIMPLLSQSAGRDPVVFKKILQRGSDILLIFAVPLVAGTFVLSPALIGLLGGGAYGESIAILNILVVAVGIIFLGTLFSFALIALGAQRALMKISLAGAVFNVALNLIFIPRYSYYAAAMTTVLTEALVAALMAAIIWRALRFLPSFKTGARALLAAGVMAAIIWYFRDWNILGLLGLGAVIYFGTLYLLREFTLADVQELIKKEAGVI